MMIMYKLLMKGRQQKFVNCTSWLFERLLLWSRDKLGGADWITSARHHADGGDTYRCQSKVKKNKHIAAYHLAV